MKYRCRLRFSDNTTETISALGWRIMEGAVWFELTQTTHRVISLNFLVEFSTIEEE